MKHANRWFARHFTAVHLDL